MGLVLATVLAIALPEAEAHADCGCDGTITADGDGPCLRYAAPSGPGNDITFRFAEAYECGQYVTGEFFVVASGAAITIAAITPDGAPGRHGADVNPDPNGPQRWDDRLGDYADAVGLPLDVEANSSVVKYVSDNPVGDCDGDADEKSCGRFAAVVTIVDAAPDDPSTAFRPPFVGADKPTLSAATLQTQLLSRLSADCADVPTLATAEAWTRHLRLDYTSDSVTCDLMPPEDAIPNGRPWSTDIWADDTDVHGWLHLADVCDAPPCTPEQDLATKMPVLVGYVQHGIDVWGVDRQGASLFRGGGGNGGGKLHAYVFAATMLADAEMLADLAAIDEERFFESASYYAGEGGVALWGQPTGDEAAYWNDFGDQSTRTIRDPYHSIDGGFEPGGWYQDNTAKPTQYTALLMRIMPALQANWPVNGDVVLAYADRWVEHGALTQPDDCAPIGGEYGVDYGPDGMGGCIAGGGRVPELDGNNANGGNRSRPFGECMWQSFRACAEDCSCPGQSCKSASMCGNGIVEPHETCDGDDAASCAEGCIAPGQPGACTCADGGEGGGEGGSHGADEGGTPTESATSMDADDTATSNASAGDTSGGSSPAEGDDDDASGCGCRSSSTPPPSLFFLLWIVAWRRRCRRAIASSRR
ncbi:hypothetical protein OV090_39945 [Nannocystis sp. RBIL2]|uniref:hypothetical protein n=1 Tax=Nannocystis sp. RBIL2 TaxID=2996788 RepID=UPI00226FCC96|nr:hypothetical protein [Nannocystis sp. RBIL2]MCY1070982.1 hypothetical protein [Nannocystis sp. RBIL2]